MGETQNTIVVTTDLSSDSKAGIRFAAQVAEKNNAELVFLYVYQVLRASSWSDVKYQHYVDQIRDIRLEELSGFIKTVFRSLKAIPKNYRIAVHHSMATVNGIIDFAHRENARIICCTTHGRKGIRRIFGSITGSLITKSDIPVLCVPGTYRVKPITSILYASDMENYENEVAQVVGLTSNLGINILMTHIAFDYEKTTDVLGMQTKLTTKFKSPIYVDVVKRDPTMSLLCSLGAVISKVKPSMLVFFTHRKRTFFESILVPSNSKTYSFNGKLPFFSINKE